jgi:hypothetical protein
MDKYFFLNRYVVSQKIGSRLSLKNQKLMGLFPIFFSITNLIIMVIPVEDGKAF